MGFPMAAFSILDFDDYGIIRIHKAAYITCTPNCKSVSRQVLPIGVQPVRPVIACASVSSDCPGVHYMDRVAVYIAI